MRIRNHEIKRFMNFLMELELKGRESRLRTRFVKLLAERQKLVEDEHYQLIVQHSNLDENNKPLIVERDGQTMYDVQDIVSFNRDYHILLNEEFIIDETEERKEMLLLIKDVILNCEKTFKGEEAILYDRMCDIVEKINYKEDVE